MKIAHISSLYHPVPPLEYGGSQRIVAEIATHQAVLCGLDVSVYAAANSTLIDYAAGIAEKNGRSFQINSEGNSLKITSLGQRGGSLTLYSTRSFSLDGKVENERDEHAQLASLLIEHDQHNSFDVIHAHKDIFLQYLSAASLSHKALLHAHDGKIEKKYRQEIPVLAISHAQSVRLKQQGFKVAAVFYNTVNKDTYSSQKTDAGYLCCLGTMKPEKGHDLAIRIARAAGKPLIIGGVPDSRPTNQLHFVNHVQPAITIYDPDFLKRSRYLSAEQIRAQLDDLISKTGTVSPVIYVGGVNDEEKATLFGFAQATLFPVRWQEPFGLVMIESMACGTPVIGNAAIGTLECGSVAEVIEVGVTGFAIQGQDEEECIQKAVQALKDIPHLNREAIRRNFENRWSTENHISDLTQIYNQLRVDARQTRYAIFQNVLEGVWGPYMPISAELSPP